MAIQYYMRGWTGSAYVDWVVNDQPDSTGAFAPVGGLTNITVNRIVTSKVGNFLNPDAEPSFIAPNYTNPVDPYFLHLNSFDWLHPSPPTATFPAAPEPIGIAVVRGVTSGTLNPYATLFWEEGLQEWRFRYINADGSIGAGEAVDMGALSLDGPLNIQDGYIAVSETTDVLDPPASTGIIRIPNNQYIKSQNSDHDQDVILIGADNFTQAAGSSYFQATNRVQAGNSNYSVHVPSYVTVDGYIFSGDYTLAAQSGFIRLPNASTGNAFKNFTPTSPDLKGLASTAGNLITLGDANNSGVQFLTGPGSSSSTPMQFNFLSNGTDLLDILMNTATGPNTNLNNTFISFGSTATLPSLTQATPLTNVSGQALHVSAQHGVGSGNLGGPVLIHAGVGPAADGYVDLGVRNSGQTLPMLRTFPNLAMNLSNSPSDYRPYGTNFTVNDGSTVSFNPVFRFPQTFLNVFSATNANPIVITTQSKAGIPLNHGFATGQRIAIAGAKVSSGINPFNGTFTVTVVSPSSFSIGVSGVGGGTYVANTGSILPVSNLFGNAVASPAAVLGPTIAQDDNQSGNGLPMLVSAQWSTFSGGVGGDLTTSGGSATTGASALGGKHFVSGGNATTGTTLSTGAGTARAGGNVVLQPGIGSGGLGSQTHGEIDFMNSGIIRGRFYADGYGPYMEIGSASSPAQTGFLRLANLNTDNATPPNKTAIAMRNPQNNGDILLIGTDQDGYVVVGNGSSVIIGGNFLNNDVLPAPTTTYIAGNLQVWGSTTIVDSTIVDIVGRVIHANWPLNPGGTPPALAPPVLITGFDVNRGYSSANVMNDGAAMLWTEGSNVVSGSDGYWRFATIPQDGYNLSPRDNYTLSGLAAAGSNILNIMAGSLSVASSVNPVAGSLPVVGALRTQNNTTAVSQRNQNGTTDLLMLGADAANHIIMGASSSPQNAGFIFNTTTNSLFDFWTNSVSEVQIGSDTNGPFVRESSTTFTPATTGFIRVPANVTAVAARSTSNSDILLLGTDNLNHILHGDSTSPTNGGHIFSTTTNSVFDFWVNGISQVSIGANEINFTNTDGYATIQQSTTFANNATGGSLTVAAQSVQGTLGIGGNLLLSSGFGSLVDGYVDLQVAGVSVVAVEPADTLGHSKFVFLQGRRRHVTQITGSYLVSLSDDLIAVTTLSAPITITLPLFPVLGDAYEIKDTTGNAGTNNITVSGNGTNIDGSSMFVLNQPYASVTLTYTGSTWSVT